MKKSVQIKNIGEVFPESECGNPIRGKINCLPLEAEDLRNHFSSAIFLNASVALLVQSGQATACINYKSYPVSSGSLLLLSVSHLFSFEGCSQDFKGYCLLVSKTFMNETDATDMIYKRIKYGVKLYNTPVMKLSETEIPLLLSRIIAIGETIDNRAHLYQNELILNQLLTFYLDLSNIIEQRPEFRDVPHPTRYESITGRFINLLSDHYRQEHNVEFYASRLNISAHYLSLILRRITGQSASDFIYEMLYSEARNLLSHSKLSIQEITAHLYFADQSSFGKFFKRKSGLSPADYRKK